ncbi:phage protein [Schinkia azotoformans LMG 9581]|uniref:Phage protein n=2 Tax=Schinkia azotoformans TaxID=1454 RepID=K6D4R3_SCHAZ|nr:phage protein [Schinkia azotoformans LMG 9581]
MGEFDQRLERGKGALSIPNKIKVAGIVYTVEEKDVVIIDDCAGYVGLYNYKDTRIEILKDMTLQRKQETLVHEVLHAVLFEFGLKDHDEELVERAAQVLYQVLKDNPNLLGNYQTSIVQ